MAIRAPSGFGTMGLVTTIMPQKIQCVKNKQFLPFWVSPTLGALIYTESLFFLELTVVSLLCRHGWVSDVWTTHFGRPCIDFVCPGTSTIRNHFVSHEEISGNCLLFWNMKLTIWVVFVEECTLTIDFCATFFVESWRFHSYSSP